MPRTPHVVLAAAGMAAVLLAAACGGNAPATPHPAPAGAAAAPVNAQPATVQPKAAPPASAAPLPTPSANAAAGTAVPDPGVLPQTRQMPGDQDPRFVAGAHALWQAIVQDKPALAKPFFFPLSAYLQVKDISDPAQDYQNRLIAWYGLDIKAAHDLLGAGAAGAKLTGVDVPQDQAEWIEPGVEYNKGSYYRVYGTRLTYQENGHTASFGVFSLISWRGEWYVVHLGPSTRSAMEGIVYDPQG
ncbi:hypothetical protein KDL01_27250 [Actinospica durhamensis]|uniref:Uncharacterized protein n=1 Tax=Actinospica durhamensis TaxID=1508375 RepID=A0A941EV43_9ACTN|nr:hypothetical protein [Actinospica durhamensis]MBR7837003.1 hypothetical protein [Actinospica durhamensis]